MAMKRTTVYAEEHDLAVIKAAASRQGIAEAEIIREAIHLAAMANREWTEPFFRHTFEPIEGQTAPEAAGGEERAATVVDQVWTDQVVAYERTKRPKRKPAKAPH